MTAPIPIGTQPLDVALVGRKAAGLGRLTRRGLPCPPAVAIPDALRRTLAVQNADDALLGQILAALGDQGALPLLVSVRSSPSHSLPGALDTILNVGAGAHNHAALEARFGPEGAWLTRFNLVASWGRGVAGLRGEGRLERDPFVVVADDALMQHGVDAVHALPLDAMRALFDRAWSMLGKHTPPDGLEAQLRVALSALASHWDGPRALAWRTQRGVPQDATCGLAVQRMVLGHVSAQGGCGVAMSRHPTRGTPGPAGDFVVRGQGDCLMGGLATPSALTGSSAMGPTLQDTAPGVLDPLTAALKSLEADFHQPVEVEFTVEDGALWLLQARPASLGAAASLRAARDLVAETRASPWEALAALEPAGLSRALCVEVVPGATRTVLARGVTACVGAAAGTVVLHAEDAVRVAAQGGAPVLVRPETRVEDVPGLRAAVAIVAARGGTTSHAAVVARTRGTPCLVGCHGLTVVPGEDAMTAADGTRLTQGRAVTLDANTGELLDGTPALRLAQLPQGLQEVLGWAHQHLLLPVVGLPSTPSDQALLAQLGVSVLDGPPLMVLPGALVPAGTPLACLTLPPDVSAVDAGAAVAAVRPLVGRLVVACGVAGPDVLRAIAGAGGDALATPWQDAVGVLVASAQASAAGDPP